IFVTNNLYLHDALPISRVPGSSSIGSSESYLPRRMVTRSGCARPSTTSSAAPFHTFWVVICLPAGYSSLLSKKRKPHSSKAWLRSEEHTSELQSRENLV